MDNGLGESGLAFFGAMTASISHEIKNRIAVINEHAGLLKDMALRARQGHDLDIERLERLADAMARQIKRTDGVVRNMNRFGHSVDRMEAPADLNQWLPLATMLFQRMADGRNARLEARPPAGEILANAPPFYLLALIYHCLDKALAMAETPYPVVLEGQNQAAGTMVTLLFPAGGMNDTSARDLTDGKGGMMASALRAEIEVARDERKVMIRLPAA